MATKVASGSARCLIACAACKARKRRCDGQKPACSNCVDLGRDCNYASIRRRRGPGKATVRAGKSTHTAQRAIVQVDIAGIPHLPDFLDPKKFTKHLRDVKKSVSPGFTPLLPHAMATRLVRISYAEAVPQGLLDLKDAMQLLQEQYVESIKNAADNPARWALVSTIIALSVRFKTAQGSESQLRPVADAFYRNATAVLHELILETPTLLSVKALLVMAAYANGSDAASGMLAAVALRQLESLTLVDGEDLKSVFIVAYNMVKAQIQPRNPK